MGATGDRARLAVLIDPFSTDPREAERTALEAREGGADFIFIGGSIGAGSRLTAVLSAVKRGADLPVVLFPGNVDGVAEGADAILFMSLLNSSNPYWIIQAQALAAPLVRALRLEAIPTAYLIVEPGGSSAAGWVGSAREIPRAKPEIAAAYAMAAELLGMRWIYLEAGSGAADPVPAELVKAVRRSTDLGILVGGGIRSPDEVAERVAAGADVIVVGTYLEEGATRERVASLTRGLARG